MIPARVIAGEGKEPKADTAWLVLGSSEVSGFLSSNEILMESNVTKQSFQVGSGAAATICCHGNVGLTSQDLREPKSSSGLLFQ